MTQIFNSGQPSYGGDRDLNLTERKHWFWNFLVESNHLSRKYIIMSYPLFKVTYQWNPDRNHKLCNIVYSMCRCSWNDATDKWKIHNGEIEIISFVGKGRS